MWANGSWSGGRMSGMRVRCPALPFPTASLMSSSPTDRVLTPLLLLLSRSSKSRNCVIQITSMAICSTMATWSYTRRIRRSTGMTLREGHPAARTGVSGLPSPNSHHQAASATASFLLPRSSAQMMATQTGALAQMTTTRMTTTARVHPGGRSDSADPFPRHPSHRRRADLQAPRAKANASAAAVDMG